MSEYNKTCTTCKQEIRMSNNTGKWLPLNQDGSQHFCKRNQNGHTVSKEPLTIEARLERLERIVLDPRK